MRQARPGRPPRYPAVFLALLLAGFARCNRLRRRRFRFFHSLLLAALFAALQPVVHPLRCLNLLEGGTIARIQQVKADAMLAGEFAAWAIAFERRAGQVDLGTVGLFATALAQAP